MTAAVGKPTPRERALTCLGKLPPFSPVLTRVIATLASEEVSFGKVAEVIEKDTVLAGNVLKMVNSALYGFQGKVNSVRHAVSLLGIMKLRNATLSLSVARMWSRVKTAPRWSSARFNLHSVAVAILADLLSQRLPVIYAEGAFTAGLFHDLGQLLIAVGLREEYIEIMALFGEGGRTLSECQEQVLGFGHAELSAEALAVWNLPLSIQTAARYHHAPDDDPTLAARGEIRLSRIIASSNVCVHLLGMPVDVVEQQEGDPKVVLRSLDPNLDVNSVLENFDTELAAIRRYF